MGRPPIGKHAMSGAERQARYLARLLAGKPSVTKPDGADSAKDREIASLKARIAEMEAVTTPELTLSMTAQQKLEAAIRAHKERLSRSYWQQVNEEVRKGIAAADDATRKHNKELLADNLRLRQMLNKRGVFTEAQFRKLVMCVHADSNPSDAVRNEMTQLLVENKRRLVRSD
jgi:hypothetical protein